MATIMDTGWGIRFFDYDLDGWPDIIMANGHPDDLIESISSSLHYKEPLLLFHNNGQGFDHVSALGRTRLCCALSSSRTRCGRPG